jgi:hypothetical protein
MTLVSAERGSLLHPSFLELPLVRQALTLNPELETLAPSSRFVP